MIKQCLILLLLFNAHIAFGMNAGKFDSLISELRNGKYEKTESFLTQNKASLVKDPDYYVLLLNCVFVKGGKSTVILSSGEPSDGDLSLTDPKSGKVVGFLGEKTVYDKKLIRDGIRQTRAALRYFPRRLDIHLGIVAIAKHIDAWDIIGDQLVEVLRISKQIHNKWTWGKVNSGEMKGNPKNFMIQNVLAGTATLFRMDEPASDKIFIKVSNALIKYYPDLVYGYANLGELEMAQKHYDAAEKYLEKAAEIDPKDEIVQHNLHHLDKLRNQANIMAK